MYFAFEIETSCWVYFFFFGLVGGFFRDFVGTINIMEVVLSCACFSLVEIYDDLFNKNIFSGLAHVDASKMPLIQDMVVQKLLREQL